MALHLDSIGAARAWLAARVAGTLTSDSRRVARGDGFLAWPGRAHDGRHFVAAALASGAAGCVVEARGLGDGRAFGIDVEDDDIATYTGLQPAAGAIAAAFFGAPAESLAVVAVTGTNGKTSTTWWLAQALTRLGRRCGVVGTLGVGDPAGPSASLDASSSLTTPDALALHAVMRRWADDGFAACAIEASSIGVVEHRLDGLHIDIAAFTNLTQDHLDYHGSMDAYRAAKRALFDWPRLRAAVVAVDDDAGAAFAAELRTRAELDLWTVSRHGRDSRLTARDLRYANGGLAFDVVEGDDRATVATALVGDYNASNLLVAAACLRALGVPLADAVAALAASGPVPGRMERVTAADGAGSDIDVVVDYAHTPDALDQLLHALRPLARDRGGRLVCVFGCGGDRDATKRPGMGAIAAAGADRVVLTSDNPRREAPAAIVEQIAAGIDDGDRDRVAVIEDRAAAIAQAIADAAPGDVVAIAGKGHEDYQEVDGVRRPFSDAHHAAAALARRAAVAATTATSATTAANATTATTTGGRA